MIDANETKDDATKRHTETHHVHYDPGAATSPSETLVIAVADIADVDPLSLKPLYESVDPHALDNLVDSDELSGVGGQLTFAFGGYDVTVRASGLFEIESTE